MPEPLLTLTKALTVITKSATLQSLLLLLFRSLLWYLSERQKTGVQWDDVEKRQMF